MVGISAWAYALLVYYTGHAKASMRGRAKAGSRFFCVRTDAMTIKTISITIIDNLHLWDYLAFYSVAITNPAGDSHEEGVDVTSVTMETWKLFYSQIIM